ncbi:thermonuclease family protein [Stutzerimonas azotifigens]|uniref:thermonuclease family protein n=1 Tax=Stutzerimonas azotifigens TaxID=291995 RepID=UPI000418E547|nr:thermonuclease family protein [Stutzerimonas azotifigens]
MSGYLKKASLVGAFFIALLSGAQAFAFCPVVKPPRQLPVASVVDGDTLRLADGRSVRLIGVNTPELGRKGKPTEPFAEAARRRLDALVQANGGRVGLVSGREAKDRYGRTLAHAYDAGGNNLEAVLLAEGLGYFVAVAPNTRLVDCHRAAEQSARSAGKGLWRRSPVIEARALSRGGFAVLRGHVRQVERNRGGIWLELDGPVVLQVPPDAKGFDLRRLQALEGRRIEARGWVSERRRRDGRARWMMRLSAPAMLQPVRQ